jgi:hypothetical protein
MPRFCLSACLSAFWIPLTVSPAVFRRILEELQYEQIGFEIEGGQYAQIEFETASSPLREQHGVNKGTRESLGGGEEGSGCGGSGVRRQQGCSKRIDHDAAVADGQGPAKKIRRGPRSSEHAHKQKSTQK